MPPTSIPIQSDCRRENARETGMQVSLCGAEILVACQFLGNPEIAGVSAVREQNCVRFP